MTRDLRKIRNIGIAAHIDAGKTTTSERILYYTGRIHNPGEVHTGTTALDSEQEERDRGITINSAATYCRWRPGAWLDKSSSAPEYDINLIDTPGHVDFTVEVERSLRVLDGAVAVFDAKEGVEAQSETVWRQATKYKVPRICFINKMDKVGADYEFSYQSIIDRLGAPAIPVVIPDGQADTFVGVIDLIDQVGYYPDISNETDRGNTVVVRPIPGHMKQSAARYRAIMLEKIAELDDALMEKYLRDPDSLQPDEVRAALRRGTIAFKAHPVYCGSAYKFVGVQLLLDGVIAYLPSPLDMPPATGLNPREKDKMETRLRQPQAPFCGLAFKIVEDKFGTLTYVRIYSGTLVKGARVLNANRNKRENVSRMFQMSAQDRTPRESAEAGDIVALIGIDDANTGDTLCDPDHPIMLERPTFPEPVVSMSIEPRNGSDKQKLSDALAKLRRQDPTFRTRYDEETGETVIAGMGELHLDVLKNRLDRDYNVEVIVGKPSVAYRETITRTAEARGLYKKQNGGNGQFGDCTIRVEPFNGLNTDGTAMEAEMLKGLNWKDNFAWENKVHGGSIPREFIPSIEYGARMAAKTGVLAGFPMINVKVTLIDGSYHAKDSNPMAFELAGQIAFKDAVRQAGPTLLEPIMKVSITTPKDFLGNVAGDLNRRRGLIVDSSERDNAAMIEAEVPLSAMFGYTTELRSMSTGRAASAMEPLKYSEVPMNVRKQILEENA
jgi:elongation factor G